MHPSLSHLEDIDARFLDPKASLVVMTENTENELSDAHDALDGIAWLCQSAAEMNAALRFSGESTKLIEIPPECLAALLRVVCTKIKPATGSPTLGAVRHVRPDLFATTRRV